MWIFGKKIYISLVSCNVHASKCWLYLIFKITQFVQARELHSLSPAHWWPYSAAIGHTSSNTLQFTFRACNMECVHESVSELISIVSAVWLPCGHTTHLYQRPVLFRGYSREDYSDVVNPAEVEESCLLNSAHYGAVHVLETGSVDCHIPCGWSCSCGLHRQWAQCSKGLFKRAGVANGQ